MRGASKAAAWATSGEPLWISEDDVVASVSLVQAIAAVRRTYRSAAAGGVVALPQSSASWDGGSLHTIGGVARMSGLAVSKTWTHTLEGSCPILAAWDSATGRLLALIEAFALGVLRNSAVTGAATAALAAEDCEVLGVIGAGKHAESQVAAVAAVRNIQKIKVYSGTEAHRVEFADRIAARSGISSIAVASADDALDQADVVVTMTRANEPFIRASMLAERVHINALGAITPEHAELDPTVVARARRVVADDVTAARALAPRELSAANAPHILSLASILAKVDGPPDSGPTVFKAFGSGITDLALAELVLERARAAGLGRPIALSARPNPRIWTT